MKHLTLLLCIIFISLLSFSQKINSPGYIIKNNGDSVHGFLQEEVKSEIVKQIRFGDQTNTAGSAFTPADVKSFGYDQGNIYKSISFKRSINNVVDEKNYFAKQLVQGEFDLFTYVEDEATYFVVFGNDTSYFLNNTIFNSLGATVVDGNFNQSIIRLAANCDKMGSTEWVIYTEKAVNSFITELNHCVAPEKATASYYHKNKMQVHPFGFVGGLPLGKESQVTIEGGIKISSPQISKKAYLGIGIHYSNTQTTEETLSPGNIKYQTDKKDMVVSIPVTLQFNFTTGIIQPFAIFGISAMQHTKTIYANPYTARTDNREFGVGGVIGIGLEGHITKSIFVNAEWRFEELLQNTSIFQYPAIGIACRF